MDFGKANIDDLDLLVNLRIAYLTEDYGNIPDNQLNEISDKLPNYFRRHLNNDLYVYVARCENDIVSCCFLLINEKPSNPTFVNGITGTVLNVYTKAEHRKKGIAKMLLNQLISDAKKMNLDYLELQATDAGYNLYKSVGFKDVISKYHRMKIVLDEKNKF